MNKFKKLTHLFAAGVAASATWIALNPDKVAALVRAFPKLSGVALAISTLLALYHSPKS